MSQPEILRAELGDETVDARVGLGGDDALFVTPSRLLVYRAEGLLSDESVETYPHGAEYVAVSEGRRKAKVTLDYGLDGEKVLKLPTSAVDEALHHVLAGVLDGGGVLDEGERVTHTFRFSELTLAVTDRRVAKHVGAAVWDEEFEQFRFADVTDLVFEEGSHATSVVLTLGDRQERIKTPNDSARRVREAIESALFDYHGVPDVEALREKVAPDPDPEPAPEPASDPVGGGVAAGAGSGSGSGNPDASASGGPGDASAGGGSTDDAGAGGGVDFGEGPDPLSANPAELSDEPVNATREDADAGVDAGVESGSEAGSNEGVGHGMTGDGTDGEQVAATVEPGDGGSETGNDGFEATGFEAADRSGATVEDVEAELSTLRAEIEQLRETVEAQGERLERQNDLVEQLIQELRQGR
jgi:hypothetical protein